MSGRYIVITVISIVGLVILLLSLVVPVRNELGWTDPVTGSRKHQTRWTWCGVVTPIETTPIIRASPLAEWIIRREGTITYDWRSTRSTMDTIWGRSVGGAIRDFPPRIFRLYFPVQENFIKSSTDEEVQQFIDIMRRDGRGQFEAIEAAYTKGRAGLPPEE